MSDDGHDAVVIPLKLVARERYSPRPNDPAKSCYVDAEGPVLEQIHERVLEVAASFLGEPKRFLFISNTSTAHPAGMTRWRQHLGIPQGVTRWRVSCTVKLDPVIVEERRSSAGVSPSADDAQDDDDPADTD